MNNEMIKCYRIDNDGCYSTIEEYRMYPHQIDNRHTYFHKLSDAKKCLVDDMKYQMDMYREGIARVKQYTIKSFKCDVAEH